MPDVDLTQPGPAGLYFRPERLTPAGWQQEMAARASLETHCTLCGSIPAPYGFGRHRACEDRGCRAEAEARMEADKAAVGALERAQTPAPPEFDPPTLFSRSEAA